MSSDIIKNSDNKVHKMINNISQNMLLGHLGRKYKKKKVHKERKEKKDKDVIAYIYWKHKKPRHHQLCLHQKHLVL